MRRGFCTTRGQFAKYHNSKYHLLEQHFSRCYTERFRTVDGMFFLVYLFVQFNIDISSRGYSILISGTMLHYALLINEIFGYFNYLSIG